MPARLAVPVACFLAVLFAVAPATAGPSTLSPGVTQAQVAAAIDQLQPGDTLTLMPGEYDGIDLDLQHADHSGLVGTAAAPITITGVADASGNLPHVVADTDSYQEGARLRTGCAYITIQNLHLSAKGGQVQAGIYVDPGVSEITISHNLVEDVTGIGIQMQAQSDIHDVLIDHNEIANTGSTTMGTGHGISAGGLDPGSATTGVYHLVVRGNLIHDLGGAGEGDCIKFLYGIYASTIEDNVTYHCPAGTQSELYGIVTVGSGVGHYTNAADDNVVQRNFVYGTASPGHSNVGIYIGPGTLVLDNVVLQSNQGIAADLEAEASVMRNLSVVNNTVYDATDYTFAIRGCQTADSSVVVTGNALVAVQASGFGYRLPDALGGMIALANYYEGQDYAEAAPPVMNKLSAPVGALFVNPSSTVPGADFMLAAGSPLVDKADPKTAPLLDFDLAMRPVGASPDVGAYELRPDLSDHWALALGFKGSAAMGGLPDGGVGAGGSSGNGGGEGTGAGSGSSAHGGCGCSTPPSSEGRLVAPGLALLTLLWFCRKRGARASATT